MATPMNPVQLAVQQQQAAAMSDSMPAGNPEIVKAQESAIQAQQQAQQQVAQVQQQAQQEVTKAQQQVQQAQMQAMQQSQGIVTKLQGQLEAARSEVIKSRAEAELAKLETQKAELFKPEPAKPEPEAPGPDYRPILRRMQGRISKALSRLERIAPHLKAGSTSPPTAPPAISLRPDGVTVDIDARPKTHDVTDSAGYNNPAAGVVLQQSGHYNQGILNLPNSRASLGAVGDKLLDSAKDLTWAKPDYAAHNVTNFFEDRNPYTAMTMQAMMQQPWQQQQPQQNPYWQTILSNIAGGFSGSSGQQQLPY